MFDACLFWGYVLLLLSIITLVLGLLSKVLLGKDRDGGLHDVLMFDITLVVLEALAPPNPYCVTRSLPTGKGATEQRTPPSHRHALESTYHLWRTQHQNCMRKGQETDAVIPFRHHESQRRIRTPKFSYFLPLSKS